MDEKSTKIKTRETPNFYTLGDFSLDDLRQLGINPKSYHFRDQAYDAEFNEDNISAYEPDRMLFF